MSLVGPRPLLIEYKGHCSTRQARRTEVPPGITGWAQIRGCNAIDWPTRLELDAWYADNRSLALDLRILAVTIGKRLRQGGSARRARNDAAFRSHELLVLMTPGVWVIGAGGHAKVAVATLAAAGRSVLGVFDSDPVRRGGTILGIAIKGPLPALDWWSEVADQALTAIGNNETRRRLAGLRPPDRWATAIHPSAVVHDSSIVCEGTLVCAQAVIHPEARVGAHAIVNTASVVEHDCVVGSYCHLAPRSCLAGSVSVGNGSFIGAGATVVPGITIGAWCVVGAGATVIRDVPDGMTVAGVPARPLRIRTAE